MPQGELINVQALEAFSSLDFFPYYHTIHLVVSTMVGKVME
jgi:hypothetical protein